MPLIPDEYKFTQKGVASLAQPAKKHGMYPPVSEPDQSLASEPYGIPDWWDYKTSLTDPDGNALPHGAVGWDQFARADYGQGFSGIWNKFVSRLSAPVSDKDEVTVPQRSGFGAVGEVNLNTPLNKTVQYVSQGLGATVGLVLDGWQQIVREAEKGGGVGTGIQEAGAGSPLPSPDIDQFQEVRGLQAFRDQARRIGDIGHEQGRLAAEQAFRELTPEQQTLGLRVTADRFKNVLNGLIINSPPVLFYNSARAWTAPGSLAEKADIVRVERDAANILYTSWFDPAARDEMRRRVIAGEDPELAAMELENPSVEIAFQVVFDPLNVVGWGMKGLRAAGELQATRGLFLNVSDDIARHLDDFGRVASDSKAVEALEGLVQARRAGVIAREAGLAKEAADLGVFSLTQIGKRDVIGRRTGELWNWASNDLLRNGGTPDDLLELAKGLILSVSKEEDEIAMGISLITGSKKLSSARPMFSQAGEELGIVLRRMVTDEAGKINYTRFLDDLKKAVASGDRAALVELVDARAGRAIDSIFPTLKERIAAGEDVNGFLRTLSKFDTQAQQFYGPANSFFANVYMGGNPGYAFRNVFVDTFTSFVDNRFVNPIGLENNLTGIRGWLGGILNRGAQEGFGPAAGAGVKGRFGALGMAQDFEQRSAAAVSYKTIENAMRSMLKPGRGLPDTTELLNAGLKGRDVNLLTDLVIRYRGDADAAIEAFRGMRASGTVDVWRQIGEWASPEDIEGLRGMGLLDKFEDILHNSPVDEVETGIRGMLDEYREIAQRAMKEHYPVVQNNPAFDEAVLLGQSGIDDGLKMTAENFYNANVNTMDASLSAAQDIRDKATQLAARNPTLREPLDALLRRHKPLLDNELRNLARQSSADVGDHYATWARSIRSMADDADWAKMWGEIGLPGQAPESLTKQSLLDHLWDDVIGGQRKVFWESVRNVHMTELEQFATQVKALGVDIDERSLNYARQVFERARQMDNSVILRGQGVYTVGPDALKLMQDNEISHTRHLMNAINANLPEGAEKYTALRNVPLNVAEEALQRRGAASAAKAAEAAGEVVEAAEAALTVSSRTGPILQQIPPPYPDGAVPSLSRAYFEQLPGVEEMFGNLLNGFSDVKGRVRSIAISDEMDKLIAAYGQAAKPRISEARLLAAELGNRARDFTLLNYQRKRNINTILAYIYPYHFWYGGTYRNWMTRLVTSPEVLSNYARYRDQMEKAHAGAPDWWKYNINSNELLGMDSSNPLFFNLEQTLNPLNGLTGVDFDDPYKRTSWFTGLLQDMNKLGPSTHSLYSIATAVSLYAQGEDEAAARWAGRLFPQSATVRSLAAKFFNTNLEVDPFTHFFSGGVDPYERRRIGRALAAMVDEELYSEADAIDAAQRQTGPIWEEAMLRQSTERAPGQLSSFFLGAGFRARSLSDIKIDRFYDDYNRFWAMADTLSPDEVRTGLDQMREQYPFMDTLLLSRKGGVERDRAYAYNVLARIPPGSSFEFLEVVGLKPELIDAFYSSKGNLEAMSEADRSRFMAAVLDLAAVLDVPEDATRAEWSEARNAYSAMRTAAQTQFGDDIWTKIDAYYAFKDGTPQGRDRANAYLDAHPEVAEALDFKSERVVNSPLLSAYYGGLGAIENYYQGLMYDKIEQELGADIWDKWDEYYTRRDTQGRLAARAYWNANPELARYKEIREEWDLIIAEKVVTMGDLLRDGIPAQIRQDVDVTSVGLSPEQFQPPTPFNQFGEQEWKAQLGTSIFNLAVDAFEGEPVPPNIQDALEAKAEELGVPGGWIAMINFVGRASTPLFAEITGP